MGVETTIDEILAPLLEGGEVVPGKKKPEEPKAQDRPKWRVLKTMVRKAINEGTPRDLEKVLDNYPEIKEREWWKTEVIPEVLGTATREWLECLRKQGAKIKVAHPGDAKAWFRPIEHDNVEAFKWLLDHQVTTWQGMLENTPYCLQYLGKKPMITGYLLDKYGVGLDLDRMMEWLTPGNSDTQRRFIQEAITGLVMMAGQPGKGGPALTLEDLKEGIDKTKLVEQYPDLWWRVAERAWATYAEKGEVEKMQDLARCQIKPRVKFLVNLWYGALNWNGLKVFRWLSRSTQLNDLARKAWPEATAVKIEGYNYLMTTVYPTVETMRELKRLGFDLGVRECHGGRFWAERLRLSSKSNLLWAARHAPEVFDLEVKEGGTLLDSLPEEVKPMVRKEILRAGVISRKHPLRSKGVGKNRL